MSNRIERLSLGSETPYTRFSEITSIVSPLNGGNHVEISSIIAKESAEKPAEPPVRILVADDDKSILEMTTWVVRDELPESYKSDIHVFADGDQLVDGATLIVEVDETDTRPLLIISDQRMPGLLGSEAIKLIREKAEEKNIAVYAIGVSAYDERNELEGFDTSVSKPFDLDDLVVKIKQGFETLNVPWPNSSTEVADIADV